jgi:hypothetical protein
MFAILNHSGLLLCQYKLGINALTLFAEYKNGENKLEYFSD